MTQEKNSPLLSVIMPVYNGEKYVQQSIESVLQQTLNDFELLVIDDGSTDATPQLVRSIMQRDERVNLHVQHNSGVSAARNSGLRAARGRYIAIIDADDLWPGDRLESQYALLMKDDNRFLIGGIKRFSISSDGKCEWGYETLLPSNSLFGQDYVKYLFTIPANHMVLFNTICGKKSLIQQYGGWDETLVSAEDWEHWLRLAQHVPFYHMQRTLQYYRKYQGSVTSREKKTVPLKCHLRIIDKVAKRQSLTYWQVRHFSAYRFKEAVQNFLYDGDYSLAFSTLLRSLLTSNLFIQKAFYRLTLQWLRGVSSTLVRRPKQI